MTKPTYQQYHIDVPLTNISIAYNPQTFIHEQVFPVVPVERITDKYFIFNKGDWLRREAQPRGPGTRAVRGGYSLSTSQYTCIEYAFATPVTDEQVRNSNNPLNPLRDGTEFVTRQLHAELESKVAADAFGTGWSSSSTPGVTWDNPSSTPIEDVEVGFETIVAAIGAMPNVGVIGYNVLSDFKNHPDIVDRIRGAAGPQSPAIVSLNAIAALFGLDKLLVGTQIENTAAEGATDSLSFIWGKHMLLAYVVGGASLGTPNAGYVMTYKNRVIERYREDQEKQDVIAGMWSFDVKLTATDAGYLLKSVVA
jgi:hypothetical protein